MKTFKSEPAEPDLDRVLVGVSEYRVADGDETLIAYGLGACVGVALYDADNGVGGLAHTLLPKQGDDAEGPDGKYVDSAVETMLREMVSKGATYGNVEAWLVGGGEIFDLQDLAKGVGTHNVEVARAELEGLDVPIRAEAVGGSHGRTVEFDVSTGELRVITAHENEPTIL